MQQIETKSMVPSSGGIANHPGWLLGIAGLLIWQLLMTFQLFGCLAWPDMLLNNQPILSGRHPLHLYHGFLGSQTLYLRGSLCCYDPAFDAGYPKTPVFDAGARPAELMLALAGGYYYPAAYKIGLAMFCLSIPWIFWIAARSLQMGRGASFLSSFLGVLLWWSPAVRDMLEAGNIDHLLAGVMLMLHSALLIRYHRQPSPGSLIGLFLTCALGWCASPLFQLLLLPLFLSYYLRVGARHNLLWHGTLIGVWIAAISVNLFWLLDWLDYWWLLVSSGSDRLSPLLEPGTTGPRLLERWIELFLAGLLLAAATFGLLLWRSGGQRTAAKTFGMGLGLLLALAVLGRTWDPMVRLGAAYLLVPAFLMAIPAAAPALWALFSTLRQWCGPVGPVGLAGAFMIGWLVFMPNPADGWFSSPDELTTLQIGLRTEQQELVDTINAKTTSDARILWEDPENSERSSQWSALLPLLTGRSFIGGLDSQAKIEHATCGLHDLSLSGRPLSDWSDSQFLGYLQRYNIGWILARSTTLQARLADAYYVELLSGRPGLPGNPSLYRVKKPSQFALIGSARWIQADPVRVILGEVTPYQDQVVLSLHYQTGMRVTPARIKIEPEFDPSESADSIPFVRLRLTEPASRVTITWEKR